MSRFTAFLACSVLVTSTYAQNILPSAQPFEGVPEMNQGFEATITPVPMASVMPGGLTPELEPSMMPAFPAIETMEAGLEESPMGEFSDTGSDMITPMPETTDTMNTFESEPNFGVQPVGMGENPSPVPFSAPVESETGASEPVVNSFEPNTNFGNTETSGMASEEGMNTFEPMTGTGNTETTGMPSEEGMNTFEPMSSGAGNFETTGMSSEEGMNTFEPMSVGAGNSETTGMPSEEGMNTFEPMNNGVGERASPPAGSMSGNEGVGEKIPCEVGETVKMACMTSCEMMKTAEMCMKRCSLIGRTVCFMIQLKD